MGERDQGDQGPPLDGGFGMLLFVVAAVALLLAALLQFTGGFDFTAFL